MSFRIPVKFFLLLALCPLLLAGCGREEIKVYRVPKEREQPRLAGEPAEHSAQPHLHWKLPAGWEELPPGEMRVGNFLVKGANDAKAQVTIIPLPGTAGRELENVNRWRGQVGLEPVTQEQLAGQAEPVVIGGAASQLYDMAGTPPEQKEKTRILASILARDGVAWFFKMTGPDALVQKEKPAFVGFLKTVSYDAGAEPPAGAAAVPTPPTDDGKPAWKVPADWKEQPAGQMQTAKFSVPGKADVTVAAFPGDVGGVLANVNRWRGQLGLPPAAAADLPKLVTPLDLGGANGMLVDMTNQDRRMVAVIVPRAGQTWFFKLLGDEPAVAKAKDSFVQFVKSAK